MSSENQGDPGSIDGGWYGRYLRLREQFRQRDLSPHVALFYESAPDHRAGATAFARAALDRNCRLLYIADQRDPEEVRDWLRAADVDLDDPEVEDAVRVTTADEAYLDRGFDPDRMLATLEEAAAEARADGYDGLWVAGENSWSTRTDGPLERVFEFERQFDRCCPEVDVTAMCLYDRRLFEPDAVVDAVQSHQQVVYEGRLCANPYHIPPESFLEGSDDTHRAQQMLEQLRTLASTRDELADREQRLSVVNRLLRHNLRNEASLIVGHLDEAHEATDDPEVRDALDRIADSVDEVLEMGRRARRIEQTLPDAAREPSGVDVTAVVETVVGDLTARRPDVEVEVDLPESAVALADREFEVAVRELLSSCLDHATGEPTLRVSVERYPECVVVDVEADGEPISEAERNVLGSEPERPLDHASGLGLWLVSWIVDNSSGTLSFPESEDRCRLRVELPAA